MRIVIFACFFVSRCKRLFFNTFGDN